MKKAGYFFVIIAAVLWGILGIFIKKLTASGFDTLQLVWIRAVGTSLTLVIYMLVTNRKLLKFKLRDSIYFIGTGIFSFTFFNLCYFVTINSTSLSVAAILLYTAPTFVMIFSAILFKEKMTFKKLLSLILTFTGCLFVTGLVQGGEQKVTVLGILTGLGAGLGYALYSIFGRYALRKYDSLTVTVYTFVFASIGLMPLTNLRVMVGLLSSSTAFYYSAALALLGTVLPFLLYTKGLSKLETGRASLIATLEPVVATATGIAAFHESITPFKSAGVLLVVLAVFIILE